MDELLPQFIIEARELIQQASDDLLALERRPGEAGRLDSAFRAVHTLKGSVGLFDLAPLGIALHAAEDVLAAVRTERLVLDAAVVDSLLACLETAERWVGAVAETGALPPGAAPVGDGLMRDLRSLVDGPGEPSAAPGATAGAPWAEALFAAGAAAGVGADPAIGTLTAIRYEPRPDCFFSGDDPVGLAGAVPGLVMLRIRERQPWPSLTGIDPFACNLIIEALALAPHAAVASLFRFVPDQAAVIARDPAERPRHPAAMPASAAPVPAREGLRTMRVDAGRVDRLATLVGELIVAKNALAPLADAARTVDPGLAERLQESFAAIDRLTGSLHAAVADVRMLPLRDVFRRFPRTIREMAARSGKTVALTVEGEDIEADKAVIEALSEPLIHVLRNAVDHGAEPPEARRAAGKPPAAAITLRAARSGNRLSIEVGDDGQGIDPARIRRIARDRGLLPPEALEALPDPAVIDLIFTPGFSTAGTVTDLSGRGVGMDAVRIAVEGLGGTVDVASEPGRGTTVRMVLPTSVVLSTILIVEAGERPYGVLMDGVIETLRIRPGGIVPIKGGEAFVFRDRTIPLVRLAPLLGLPAAAAGAAGSKVLVVQVDGEPVGVAIDRLVDRSDVMMRPMAGLLAGAPGLIGTTILGDGSVLMILDVAELIR